MRWWREALRVAAQLPSLRARPSTPCVEVPWNSFALRLATTLLEARDGPRPVGSVRMHLCDNGNCVNVDHFKWGTVAENRADCVAKGRHRVSRRVAKLRLRLYKLLVRVLEGMK